MNSKIHGPYLGNSPPPSSSTGVSVDEWVGEELLPHRASSSTRIYFVNANGIRYGARGGEMNEVCTRVLEGNSRDEAGHLLKELVLLLWQALHPSAATDGNTVELQEQEYIDLFVLAWGSIRTWKTLDLKNKAMETKVMVYQLSKTSPEVFESLWTKTGRLSIVKETKAW
jgi:hypothetical protein